MRRTMMKLGAAVLSVSFGSAAFAQQADRPAADQRDQQTDSARTAQDTHRDQYRAAQDVRQQDRSDYDHRQSADRTDRDNAQGRDDYVMVEERTVFLMANEPQQHFILAHAALARNDNRAAAEETRLAAAYLEMQTARDRDNGGQEQQNLQQQAQNLRRIARQLEHGNSDNITSQQLDGNFARASQALAKHYDMLARNDLQKQRYIAAGYDLDATATSFKNTIAWSNASPSREDLTMISNAREIAANLRSHEVYEGEQALHQQKQSQDRQDQQAANNDDRAQQASADLPRGVTNSPLTGTTPAEARNDAQHAQAMVSALGQAIDQYGNRMGASDSASAPNGNSSPDRNSNQPPRGSDDPNYIPPAGSNTSSDVITTTPRTDSNRSIGNANSQTQPPTDGNGRSTDNPVNDASNQPNRTNRNSNPNANSNANGEQQQSTDQSVQKR